ncbi:MAG: hypothetical protein HBSAPP03_16320 [Phycisphaerae bacterium]|nr:MAG: hypothetical protein HBSAPP03_16320 [Phycisphaerae bacterium]
MQYELHSPSPHWSVVFAATLGCGIGLCLVSCDTGATVPPSGGQTTDDALIDRGNRSFVASPEGIDVTNRLPLCFVRGSTGGLEVDENYGRNRIRAGSARVPRNALADRSFERTRRVENLAVAPDVVIVMVNVSRGPGGAAYPHLLDGATAAPALLDTQGTRYLPVGCAYLDASWAHVRFEPGTPIETVAALPPTSRSRPDQFLWLIYRANFGVSLARITSDNGTSLEFAQPIRLNVTQGD